MSIAVLTLGGATYDIFIHCDNEQTIEWRSKHELRSFLLLQEGEKIEVNGMHYAVGGGATNAAVAFKRLGCSVTSLFKVGEDYQGSFIVQRLRAEGVHVDFVCNDKVQQTGISYIIPSPLGNRTVLAFRGANAHLRYDEIPIALFNQYTCIYITSLSGTSAQLLLPVVQEAHAAGCVVAHNPGMSQIMRDITLIQQSLKYVDILILNRVEAQQLLISLFQSDAQLFTRVRVSINMHVVLESNPLLLQNFGMYQGFCCTIVHFFQAVSSYGPRTIVVTNGAEGVYVYRDETLYFRPTIPVQQVSTVGAGDAFGSTFVAGLFLFNSVEQAITAAIINSGSVIGHLGAQDGLLFRDKLCK